MSFAAPYRLEGSEAPHASAPESPGRGSRGVLRPCLDGLAGTLMIFAYHVALRIALLARKLNY